LDGTTSIAMILLAPAIRHLDRHHAHPPVPMTATVEPARTRANGTPLPTGRDGAPEDAAVANGRRRG
jgi:hypothetical protein